MRTAGRCRPAVLFLFVTDDFFGQDLSLPALAGDSGRIAGVRFVDCELRGPAVVRVGPGFLLVGTAEFDLPQAEALRGGEAPPDAILIDDCFVDGSRFHGVAVVGDPDELARHFGDCVFGDERAPYRAA
jgi:hypothetical protein